MVQNTEQEGIGKRPFDTEGLTGAFLVHHSNTNPNRWMCVVIT